MYDLKVSGRLAATFHRPKARLRHNPVDDSTVKSGHAGSPIRAAEYAYTGHGARVAALLGDW